MKVVSLAAVAVAMSLLSGCSSKSTPEPDAGTPDGGTSKSVTVHTLAIVGTTAPRAAEFVGMQDGTGAWEPVTPSGADYTFAVHDPSGRYAVVVVCPLTSSGSRQIQDLFLTTAEVTDLKVACPADNPGSTSVTETLTDWDGAVSAHAWVGPVQFVPVSDGTTTAAQNVPAGTYDVLAYSQDASGNLLKGVLNHDVIVNGANQTLSADFNSGFSFSHITLSITGLEAGDTDPVVLVSLLAANQSSVSLHSSGTSPTFTASVVPDFALDVRDFHTFTAAANQTDNRQRGIIRLVQSPASSSFNLPPGFTSASAAPTGTTPVGVSYQWVGGPAQAGIIGSAMQTTVNWVSSASPGWLGTTAQFTVPDPSAAAGWDASWNLQAGQNLDWVFYSIAAKPGWADLLLYLPYPLVGHTDGTEFDVAFKSGSFTP